MQTRRQLIRELGALICAPAIVRAASLMQVKAWTEPFVSLVGIMPTSYNGGFYLPDEWLDRLAMAIKRHNAMTGELNQLGVIQLIN